MLPAKGTAGGKARDTMEALREAQVKCKGRWGLGQRWGWSDASSGGNRGQLFHLREALRFYPLCSWNNSNQG